MIADAIIPGGNLFEMMEALTEKLNHPLALHYTEYTMKSILICTLLYAFGIGIYYANRRNYRRGRNTGRPNGGMPRSCVKSTRRSLMPTISCLHKISAWGLTVTAIKGT